MRTTSHLRRLAFGLVMAFGFAPAVMGQVITIPAGTDYLVTQPGSLYDFGAPVGVVDFMGNPIGPGNTDTIVERQADATVGGGSIPIQITALSLISTAPVSIGGFLYNVGVGLDPANLGNDTGTMTFAGGTINGTTVSGTLTDTLTVYFEATFQPTTGGPAIAPVFGFESFVSNGSWHATLVPGSNEVADLVINDTHTAGVSGTAGYAVHVVETVPEPGTLAMGLAATLIVSAYARWRRQRA